MDARIADSLKGWPLCRRLAAEEFEAIAAIAARLELGPGQELFREGDAGDGVYLIVSGQIEVIKRAAGAERPLARLGPGSVLGEMSLLTDEPRSASARAIAPCAVLRLPAASFLALLDSGSGAALKIVAGIAEVLARRLAAANAKVLELSERLDRTSGEDAKSRDERLAELHRSLQVWSF